MDLRSISDITDFAVHHSDGSQNQTPLQIDAEHRAEDWAMIGYNLLIGADGTVYMGRPAEFVPSAALGRNEQSFNVCLLGDYQPGTEGYNGSVPAAQLQALKDVSVWAHLRYPTIERIIGHRDVAPMFHPENEGYYSTSCPGDTLYSLLPEVRAYTIAQLQAAKG